MDSKIKVFLGGAPVLSLKKIICLEEQLQVLGGSDRRVTRRERIFDIRGDSQITLRGTNKYSSED